MLLHTRRRALGLLLAAGAAMRLPALSPVFAQAKKECLESKSFGPWRAQASDRQAGARINEVTFDKPCDLQVQVQVSESYESKLVIYGDPDDAPLPKDFLVNPENRLIVRGANGEAAVDEPLCGNCTDIFDDKVSIVMPLATAPLLREERSVVVRQLDTASGEGRAENRFQLTKVAERSQPIHALAFEERRRQLEELGRIVLA